MYARKYEVKITGTTPLLMHNDNLTWAESMDEWRKDPHNKKNSVAGDDRTPAWRWIGNLYIDQGLVCLPSDNIMTMLREGGAKCPTGKGQATFKRQTQSGIVVDQAAWPIHAKNGLIEEGYIESLIENPNFPEHIQAAKDLGFDLFVKRAKIGQAKHVRVRPRFDSWECGGTITVLDESITEDILESILHFGGMFSGIGDWRPSSPRSPGSFGKFISEISLAS